MGKVYETRPGAVFGRLTVLGQYRKGGKTFCLCACTCGSVKSIYSHSLGKLTNSCGCLQGTSAQHIPKCSPYSGLPTNTKRLHRLTERERKNLSDGKVRAYRSWNNMWQRVSFPCKTARYGKYQSMLAPPQEWLDFDAFFADMGECPVGHTLDRVDTRIGYSKDNCRWATRAEQVINRECTRFYTDGSRALDRTNLAKLLGTTSTTLNDWEKKGQEIPGWRLISYEESLSFRKANP